MPAQIVDMFDNPVTLEDLGVVHRDGSMYTSYNIRDEYLWHDPDGWTVGGPVVGYRKALFVKNTGATTITNWSILPDEGLSIRALTQVNMDWESDNAGANPFKLFLNSGTGVTFPVAYVRAYAVYYRGFQWGISSVLDLTSESYNTDPDGNADWTGPSGSYYPGYLMRLNSQDPLVIGIPPGGFDFSIFIQIASTVTYLEDKRWFEFSPNIGALSTEAGDNNSSSVCTIDWPIENSKVPEIPGVLPQVGWHPHHNPWDGSEWFSTQPLSGGNDLAPGEKSPGFFVIVTPDSQTLGARRSKRIVIEGDEV